MFPNWDLTREGLGQASSLRYSPANGWEWGTLNTDPARPEVTAAGSGLARAGHRAVTGGERVGAGDKGRELAAVKGRLGRAWGSSSLAGLARQGRDSLVGDEWSTARSRPRTRDNLFNENYDWPMLGLHLQFCTHIMNHTNRFPAPHYNTLWTNYGFIHLFNLFAAVLSGRFCRQGDKTLITLESWIGLRFEFSVRKYPRLPV